LEEVRVRGHLEGVVQDLRVLVQGATGGLLFVDADEWLRLDDAALGISRATGIDYPVSRRT